MYKISSRLSSDATDLDLGMIEEDDDDLKKSSIIRDNKKLKTIIEEGSAIMTPM